MSAATAADIATMKIGDQKDFPIFRHNVTEVTLWKASS